MDKRSVKLKKIFIDCVRFWYIVLVFAVLGGLLGWYITAKYNKDVDKQLQEMEKAKAETESTEELPPEEDVVEETKYTLEECMDEMTEEELEAVKEAYILYQDMKGRSDYLENSPYYRMDPYDCKGVYLHFQVIYNGKTISENEEDGSSSQKTVLEGNSLQSYVHALKLYVSYNGLVDDIVEKEKVDTTAMYLAELISFNDGGKNTYDDFFVITILQTPETEKLTDAVRDAMIRRGEKLAENYPGFGIKLQDQTKASYYNGSIFTSKESQKAAIATAQGKVDAATKEFTKYQTAYMAMLVNGTEEESFTTIIPGVPRKEEKEKAPEVEEEKPQKRNMKAFVAFGFIAGLFLGFVLIFLGNLFSGRLQFMNDFSGIYGIRGWGAILEKEKEGIAGKLQRAEYPDMEKAEEAAYLYLTLKQACEKRGIKEAYLVSSLDIKEMKGVKALEAQAKKDGITLRHLSGFPAGTEEVKKMLSSGGVVLTEVMHRSRLKKMDRIVEFCRENEVPVLGAVGIVE